MNRKIYSVYKCTIDLHSESLCAIWMFQSSVFSNLEKENDDVTSPHGFANTIFSSEYI